ncbi:uncharacterized protein LOC133175181 [Saccostrea echinata]|uniref:uncharacterized protein LOC133175181 n=1 Tax=Saccostrea echinata TaxID=191078 RepID=UPI002A81BE9C|nr:uncharacterized protein LOC133175181 [Saccostrea echinata]
MGSGVDRKPLASEDDSPMIWTSVKRTTAVNTDSVYSDYSDENSDRDCGSSSFEETIDEMTNLGTQPYLFEPEASTDEESTAASPPEATNQDRLGNNDWCTCGRCPPVTSIAESVCCQEIPQVMAVLEGDPGKPCIIEHTGFQPVCLHPSVLRTAYYVYRQQYEELPETDRRMRYIGYRQLARCVGDGWGDKSCTTSCLCCLENPGHISRGRW